MDEGILAEKERTEFVNQNNPSFYGQEQLTYKQMIMVFLAKISNLTLKEFKAGYTEVRPIKIGDSFDTIEKYIEDTRKPYIEAVDNLNRMMITRRSINKTINDEIKKILEELEKRKESIPNDDEWVEEKLLSRHKILEQLYLLFNEGKVFDKKNINVESRRIPA